MKKLDILYFFLLIVGIAGCSNNDVSLSRSVSFSLGGTVSGLSGGGLVVQNNDGEDLIINENGPFRFNVDSKEGDYYSVTVLIHPRSPGQACRVLSGSGYVGRSMGNEIEIRCSEGVMTVGGMVRGLKGDGLVLRNNNGDSLKVSANGGFVFDTALRSGSPYEVKILSQPKHLTQECVVKHGKGRTTEVNVGHIEVSCTTETFRVSGGVSGLSGAGLVLQNNSGENISISENGSFQFEDALHDGATYQVSVLSEPRSLSQTCHVGQASGRIIGAHVTNIMVHCKTDSFKIGGRVQGLSGRGLVLQNNKGDNLFLDDGSDFHFKSRVRDSGNYAVTILKQPVDPIQTCGIQSGQGRIDGGDIQNVVIECVTETFKIGVTVAGLNGNGLVLQNNGGNDMPIDSDGRGFFSEILRDTESYGVTVSQQPSMPDQTCSVRQGSGRVMGQDVERVVVHCVTSTFTVGGTVSGLAGSGFVLQNNYGDDLRVDANGGFVFATVANDESDYSVSVFSQPNRLAQICSVRRGSGHVQGGNIGDIAIDCVTSQFIIGGMVEGLVGKGLVIQSGSGDHLDVNVDGRFSFNTTVNDSGSYVVRILEQPKNPIQTCSVAKGTGSGSVSGADVGDVKITCVTSRFMVRGTVSGLTGEGLVLQNNRGDNIQVRENGLFLFTTQVSDSGSYVVSVLTQPAEPAQTCGVRKGSGRINGESVLDISVNCVTNSYVVGGTVRGLNGSNLVLQNNGGSDLKIGMNGGFVFSPVISDGNGYAVTVLSHPGDLAQTCSVSQGNGRIKGLNVSDVQVHCVTNTFSIGGTVSGLTGAGLVLQNNSGEELQINMDGGFVFNPPVGDGSSYAVRVKAQPRQLMQTCEVVQASGRVQGRNVSNIAVNCLTDRFTVGGIVNGLNGHGLVLKNNDGEILNIASNGGFVLPAAIRDGSSYRIEILDQPKDFSQHCSVSRGNGSIQGRNISHVSIDCVTNRFRVGGIVKGLAGSGLILQNNNGDNLNLKGGGDFVFGTSMDDGSTYAVKILSQPSSLAQECAVSNSSGKILNRDVSDIVIDCVTRRFTIGGRVSGLSGSHLVLKNNSGEDLSVDGNGYFIFKEAINDGGSYSVKVKNPPGSPNLGCRSVNGTGTIKGADINNITVRCVRQAGAHKIETEDLGRAGKPSLVIDREGNVTAVWQQSDGIRDNQWANRYTVGVGWGRAQRVETDNLGTLNAPKLVTDDFGNVTSLWTQSDGKNFNLWANRYSVESGWGIAEKIEMEDLGDTSEPMLVVDHRGNVTAVWFQWDGVQNKQWANRYTVSRGWGKAEKIQLEARGSVGVSSLVVDAKGNVMAVWMQSDGTRDNQWANHYSLGMGWGKARKIETDNLGSVSKASVVIDDFGNVTAVWQQSDGTRNNQWANRYAVKGGWGKAQKIETENQGSVEPPVLAIDPKGNVMALWSQWDGVRSNQWGNRYLVGSGWGKAEKVENEDFGNVDKPVLVVDLSGNVTAVWPQWNGKRSDQWSNRYTVGSGWGQAKKLGREGLGHVNNPVLTVDTTGNVMAVWRQWNGSRNNLWSNRYRVGTGWGSAEKLEYETSGNSSGDIVLAVDSTGDISAVWTQSDGKRDNQWANRYTVGVGWGTAQKIESEDLGNASDPTLVVDHSGNVTIVWSQSDGQRSNQWANRFE